MKITKANGKTEYAIVENLKKRSGETDPKIVEIVTSILNGVKEGGDAAVPGATVLRAVAQPAGDRHFTQFFYTRL